MNFIDLAQDWSRLWLPPERLPLSAWAERNLTLSSEYAARTGPLRLYAWQRQILDSFSDPRVETTVLMCGTQLIKTLFIQAALAYSIKEAPGPSLVVQPKDLDAKAFSRERLAPMIRDCAALRGVISEAKGRDASNTILSKDFPGGTLALVGAIAPGNLARRSIRYLFCDETDKYPLSAGGEGDPIDLAWERTVTFGSRRKRVLACSPTVAGRSRIGKAYDASDRRKPWVPCHACGQFQVLKWAQIKWDSDIARELRPASARYECEHCGAPWGDIERWAACDKAEWRAERPFVGTAGFWISHLYSPWKRMSELVGDFLDRHRDRQRYQVFVNTSLAELWTEQGETPDEELLFARRENYPFGDSAVVPQRGLFLTAAVDVQDSPPRLECEIVAWGRNRENWSIDHRTVQVLAAENGQPLPVTSTELWDKLNTEVLQRDFRHASGQTMPIMVMAVDTGSRPKPVYEFAKQHAQPIYSGTGLSVIAPRTVLAIKGTDDGLKIISSVSKENASQKRQGVRIIGIGTHCVKQELYDLLRDVKPRADGGAQPGCYHFPFYEKSYFEGLCSEKRVIHNDLSVAWEKRGNARNEPLDLKVYNRGAATVFGIDRMTEEQWRAFEAVLAPQPEASAVREEVPLVRAQEPERERWIPRRNWFNR